MACSKFSVPGRGRRYPTCVQLSPIVPTDPRPIVPIQISGKTVQSLWDTGSAITLINQATAKAIGMNTPSLPLPPLVVRSASGHPFKILGLHNLTFGIRNEKVLHSVFVLQGIKTPCIIGADFLLTHKISLIPSRLPGQSSLTPHFGSPLTITNPREVTIPARTELMIKGKISTDDGLVMSKRGSSCGRCSMSSRKGRSKNCDQ